MALSLSSQKILAAQELGELGAPGKRVVLTTHINPDGDGLGSEVGLALALMACGSEVSIANPTPTPHRFQFLFREHPTLDRSGDAVKAIRKAEAIVVLDIADIGRLGALGPVVQEAGVPVACIDHHVSPGTLPPGPRYVDPTAAATGELVYEIVRANQWRLTKEMARAIYVALVTDTGGFRFSNTHPRTLRIAAELLETGIDPESVYLDVYANAPPGRPRLFAAALQTLVVEQEVGLAWVTVPPGAIEEHAVTSDDIEGIVEFPRSVAGVKMALLFRQISQGRVKISFRSVGPVDVAGFARKFGGGGHTKAAGASLEGSLASVQELVLTEARRYLSTLMVPA